MLRQLTPTQKDISPSERAGPAHLLIVDDEPSARATLEALLFPEGYTLTFANDGREALAKLETCQPDTILLDVMMPGMDGFTVCERLKSNPDWQHIPVILITALDSKKDLVRGLEAGADEFLNKPVSRLELRARVRTMLRIKQQYDELKATLTLRDELARMVAHDMRAPLSTILGYSQLILLRHIQGADCERYVQTISIQAERLNDFINDMLLLAKMEQGKLLLNKTLIDLNSFLAKVYDQHAPAAKLKNIDLRLDLPASGPEVLVDANLFQRLFDNLLSNAMKFSPANSTVTIQLDASAVTGSVRIRVKDEGPGISPEHRARIFDKFETVSMANKNVMQVGLGLAFCKMIALAHDGKIYFEANTPTGSIFTVEI